MSDQSDINLPPVPKNAAGDPPPADPLPPAAVPATEEAVVTSESVEKAEASAPYAPRPDFGSSDKPAYQRPDDTAWGHTWRVFSARVRNLSEQVGRRLTQRTLKIGVSARIFHPESGAKGLQGKTLQYLEESIAQWVMSRDVLVFMIPTVNTNGMLHPSKIR